MSRTEWWRAPITVTVIANINTLIGRARAEDVPVIWVQHSDDHLKQEDTELEAALTERGVGRLVGAGAQTDACIRSILHGGIVRGYDVTLVGDAHTTKDLTEYGAPAPEQVIAYTNLYWKWQSAPGRRGETVDTAEVTFAAGDAGCDRRSAHRERYMLAQASSHAG